MKKIFIVTLIVLLAGCKRKEESSIGPSICPSSSFTSTGLIHEDTVNFTSADVAFTATFSEQIDWSIIIKGNTSGAVKRYSGSSKTINETWLGTADTALFFGLELCEVSFKIACREATTTTILIQGKPTFNNISTMKLVKDFDGLGMMTLGGGYGNYDVVNQQVNAPADPSPQGGNYYHISGAATPSQYYFGGVDGSGLSIPWSDPEQVYFNVFMKSDGITNSEMSILFNGGAVAYRKVVSFAGWKLVSFKLSDVEIQNATAVTTVSFSLGSAPDKGTSASVKMDFMIFTYGKPFYEETF